MGLLSSDKGLNELHFADCGFHFYLILMELLGVLTSELTEWESRMAWVRRLEELVQAAELDSAAFRAVRACVN